MIVHGLDLSYFTGKLEGYLRCKGLPYRLQEMDTAAFRALAARTGVRQMPQLELPDGRWLTDTPVILDVLEREIPEPSLTPADPALAFLAALIETYGDEHLWRPALYYRSAFAADAPLMSGRIAEGMLRDVRAPLLRLVEQRFLPELAVNGEAVAAGRAWVSHVQGAARFRYRANPFRAWRLDRLRRAHAALEPENRARLSLTETSRELLSATPGELRLTTPTGAATGFATAGGAPSR